MKTISKEFAKKISDTVIGMYNTKRYRYFDMCGHYYRVPLVVVGTTGIYNRDNWERLEVRS